jgi:hypothetical protein
VSPKGMRGSRSDDIRKFEKRFKIVLPEEYGQFLMSTENVGMCGPRYGLVPFGTVPSHWSEAYNYSKRLRRPFPLSAEWVWEDDPFARDRDRRIASVNDGVLFLGEEGCGARWVLVVCGARAGEVWLTTGEGAAPSGCAFRPWLERFAVDGQEWWTRLVQLWGPSENIWFAAHAAKQLYASYSERKGVPLGAFAQSSPLCADCIRFFSLACSKARAALAISSPNLIWTFSADGEVKTVQKEIAGG